MQGENVIPFRAHDWQSQDGRFFRKQKPLPETLYRNSPPIRSRSKPAEPQPQQAVTERKPVQAAVSVTDTFAARVAALMAEGLSYRQAAERLQDEATA